MAMKKRVFSLFALALTMLVMSSSVFAQAGDQLSGDPGEVVYEVLYEVQEDGTLQEISHEQFESQLRESESFWREWENQSTSKDNFTDEANTGDISPMALFYLYSENYNTRIMGPGVQVSNELDCTGQTANCSIVVTTAHTFTDSFQAGLNTSQISAIKAAASFTWVTSIQNGTGTNYSFPVEAGRAGYVQFFPYYNESSGILETWSIVPGSSVKLGDEWVTSVSPQFLPGPNGGNDVAGGVYRLFYTR